MITVKHLSFHEILQDISLEIPEHGVTGLVGPNGSGKTTLLRCLFGANRPTSGEVLIDGRKLSTLSARQVATALSVVSQDQGEPPPMTVAEVVRLGRLPHKDNNESSIVEALERVGMADKATRPLSQLSGGERQRVMIARAYVQDTKHMLLDEPTNHLDIYYQLEVFNQIANRPYNSVVVLHDLNHALQYCDTVHLLNHGRIVASGPPNEVLVPEVLEPIYRVRVIRTSTHLHFERKFP
ncbi:ABC transporter ATP-binding protein [Corynebacterium cystitidis]|uniref:Iron complex transport system ATP-binding protein n=1 Tax=Corynebacterium cystitidis DSM 20524 TaxID=1121357 RepID=A0A1H9VUS3_9CORY|nr:ABC transporter ATP-binding protein [Corynebacterium cystitidis]WJY81118.1 Iron(3+)-hydroxamate import ATP-binding protein FhuC [Corynebacterium cystitidis DSM 20524]SES25435.1 iron complex transport system ATP-binding protein [Corynebacterium cystitidis DSM 20524]SNV89883.1 zinc ABC transport system ATP-binding protein [Corynebacterium cystitidis]